MQATSWDIDYRPAQNTSGNPHPPADFAPGLPLPAAVDYSGLFGPCGQQGAVGNCAWWATIDGALALELQMIYGPSGWSIQNPAQRPSVRYAFLENQYMLNVPLPANVATFDNQVTRFMFNYGTCAAAQVPSEQPAGYWEMDWNDDVREDARFLDIENYWQLNTDFSKKPQLKNAIRTILGLHKRAVVLGFDLSPLQPGLDSGTREHPWVWTDPGFSLPGAHAVCLVGYDDSAGAFLARNSYGPDTPQQGYFWFSYENFTNPYIFNHVNAAYVVHDEFDQGTAQHYLHESSTSPPPARLRATCGGTGNSIQLLWDGHPDTTEYIIYRDLSNVPYHHYYPPFPGATNLFTDTTASPNVIHTYWIEGVYEHEGTTRLGMRSRPVYGWRVAGAGSV